MPQRSTGLSSQRAIISVSSSELLKGYLGTGVLLNALCEQKRQFMLQLPLLALMMKQASTRLPK